MKHPVCRKAEDPALRDQEASQGIFRSALKTIADYPAKTPESDALSKALRKAGFNFVGSTTMYAFMQAVGMVDDHSVDCFRK